MRIHAMTLSPWDAATQRSSTRNVAKVARPNRANGAIARGDRVFKTGIARTKPTLAATKIAGYEIPTAGGPSAARPHRNPVRSGVLSHSTARAISPRATKKSVAYGLISPPWRIGVYPIARIATAITHATPFS